MKRVPLSEEEQTVPEACQRASKKECGAPAAGRSTARMGLCKTCSNLPGCVFRDDSRGPVLFCEEFDDFVEALSPVLLSKSGGCRQESENVLAVGGLCVNCAARATCGLPKAEGGVWYCEEYE